MQYWIEKNGWVDLLLDSGRVDRVHGFVVYMNDHFSIGQTLDGDSYKYFPNLDDRGDIRGFCSAIRLKDGNASVHYMSLVQMQEHRDKYGMGLDKPDCAWNKSFEGRGVAACVKLHIRRLALAPSEAPALAAAASVPDGDDVGPVDWKEIAGVTAAEVETALKQKRTEPAKAEAKVEKKTEPGNGKTATKAEPVKAEGDTGDRSLF